MSNPSKAKGTKWETAIVNYLRDLDLYAKRKPLTGNLDQGDIEIEGLSELVIQAKSWGKYALAEWVRAANDQARNSQVPIGVVWAKCKGKTSPGAGYVIMDGETFVEIMATMTGLHEALREAPQR